ncbi:MAG: L-ribulose-5-phosphate 4-epimerase AraD [Blastochloris sp.]|nr:L-ribulose-5-phosphate 4-epimerase AraD [Blastochloris sp.]
MNFQSLREECFEANLALPRTGLVDLTFGNVSVLDRERGVFAIKPSGVDYRELSPEQMVLLDLEGRLVEGSLRPSSDTPTHRCLLRAFTGIRSVVHTHSRHAVAFAQAGQGIPCFGTTHADYFHGEVPVTRALTTEEISGEYEWETGQVIVERFTGLDPLAQPAVLVRHHGPFVWAGSGSKAVETAQALEIVAEMALKTRQLNPESAPIPGALHDKHFLRKHGVQCFITGR